MSDVGCKISDSDDRGSESFGTGDYGPELRTPFLENDRENAGKATCGKTEHSLELKP